MWSCTTSSDMNSIRRSSEGPSSKTACFPKKVLRSKRPALFISLQIVAYPIYLGPEYMEDFQLSPVEWADNINDYMNDLSPELNSAEV